MKVLILTYGTRGDVQPYLALAKRLKNNSHEVLLATSSRFSSFVGDHGVSFAPLSDDLLKILDTDDGKNLLEETDTLFKMIRQGLILKKKVSGMTQKLLRESWQVAKDFEPTHIVFHPKALAAPHIAEKLGTKIFFATPIPMYVPTKEFSFLGFSGLNLGGWFNRFSFLFIQKLTEWAIRGYVHRFRKEIGLPRVRTLKLLKKSNGEPILSLHLHSPSVLPQPKDWPSWACVTGYCFLDREDDWEPPQKLLDFLKGGRPPVYIGFGSMAGKDPKRLAQIIKEAVIQCPS